MSNEDITRNRHGGNAESTLANRDGNKKKDEARVFEIIKDAGDHGITLDEVAERMDRTPNSISGRISQLKKDGKVAPNGERRKTRTGSSAAVIVALPPKKPWEIDPN